MQCKLMVRGGPSFIVVTVMGFAHAFGPCEVLHPVVRIKIFSFALVYEHIMYYTILHTCQLRAQNFGDL